MHNTESVEFANMCMVRDGERVLVQDRRDPKWPGLSFPGGHVEHAGSAIEEFKAGMVLMALQAKKPIVPVYLKRRTHWYERLRIAVGQPIDIIARYGERPKMSEIEEIARLVREKEEELKALTD